MNIAWPAQGYLKDAKSWEYFDLDIRGVHVGFDTTGMRDTSELVEESDEWQITRNGWGAQFKYWKHHSGTPEHIKFEIETPQDWQPYKEGLLAGESAQVWDLDAIRENYTEMMATDHFIVSGHLFVVETLRHALGDINMLESLVLEPDWVKDIKRTITDVTLTKFDLIFWRDRQTRWDISLRGSGVRKRAISIARGA